MAAFTTDHQQPHRLKSGPLLRERRSGAVTRRLCRWRRRRALCGWQAGTRCSTIATRPPSISSMAARSRRRHLPAVCPWPARATLTGCGLCSGRRLRVRRLRTVSAAAKQPLRLGCVRVRVTRRLAAAQSPRRAHRIGHVARHSVRRADAVGADRLLPEGRVGGALGRSWRVPVRPRGARARPQGEGAHGPGGPCRALTRAHGCFVSFIYLAFRAQ